MNTKIEAAKICQLSGCSMIIANGLYLNPIEKLLKKIMYMV
jgi:glutamate 5-kinase